MGFWLRRLAAAIFLALSLAACTSTGQQSGAGSGAAATGDEGSSFDHAVVLNDAHTESEGVRAEHQWVAAHYPGWGWGTQYLINQNGRPYDLIEISRGDEHRKVYFDISNWFGHME